jgi:AcrR family transcriptional regulator
MSITTAPDNETGPSRRALRTRRELIEAAQTILVAEGMPAITVKAVTRKADLAHGTFYNYFDSVEQILAEVLKASLLEAAETLHHRYRASLDSAVVMAQSLATVFEMLASHPVVESMIERPIVLVDTAQEVLTPFGTRDLTAAAAQYSLDVDRLTRLLPLHLWMMVGALADVRSGKRTRDDARRAVVESGLFLIGLPEDRIPKLVDQSDPLGE